MTKLILERSLDCEISIISLRFSTNFLMHWYDGQDCLHVLSFPLFERQDPIRLGNAVASSFENVKSLQVEYAWNNGKEMKLETMASCVKGDQVGSRYRPTIQGSRSPIIAWKGVLDTWNGTHVNTKPRFWENACHGLNKAWRCQNQGPCQQMCHWYKSICTNRGNCCRQIWRCSLW